MYISNFGAFVSRGGLAVNGQRRFILEPSVAGRWCGLLLVFLCWLVASCGTPGARAAQSVTLAWDPNPEPDVAGYRLRYREAGTEQVGIIDVGRETIVTVPNLKEGRTYLFAVTAYNLFGLESLPSEELPYTVPAPAVTLKIWPLIGTPGAFHVSFPTVGGFRYMLQTSEDLSNWTTVWVGSGISNGETIRYVDSTPPASGRRFYRAVLTD